MGNAEYLLGIYSKVSEYSESIEKLQDYEKTLRTHTTTDVVGVFWHKYSELYSENFRVLRKRRKNDGKQRVYTSRRAAWTA